MNNNFEYQKKLAAIAQDFYLSHMTISEISNKYSLSRYLIRKHLAEAVQSGLVTININSPISRNLEVEIKLKKKFGIKYIYVIKNTSNPETDQDKIIEYAAEELQSLIKNCKIVGLTWGGTVYNIIDHFHHHVREDLVFTQFIGENMKYKSQAGSMRMVEKAANKYSAAFSTIPAPLYIVNPQLRKLLKKEPAFEQTLHYVDKMNLIFMGLGTLGSIDSIACWKKNKSRILPHVNSNDVAGILFGRPYDINGKFLISDENASVFGADLQTILTVPYRFAIVKSKFKVKATLGALRGHLINGLVTDEAIANRVLLENKTTQNL